MSLAAIVQGFQLMLQRAVRVAGVCPGGCQRMGIDEGMERRVCRIVRKEAAAVGAKELVLGAGVAEREEKVVRLLRV